MRKEHNILIRDMGIIVLSILIALILAQTGVLKNLLASTQQMRFIGSFVAGIFFTSVFTTAPAVVVLGEMAQSDSVWLVALFGGIGALVGDVLIFRFVKDRLSKDLIHILKKSGLKRFASIFRSNLFKWLIPFIGALIIASPLPDELGISMMGLYKVKMLIFIPLSFLLNSVGILIIGLIAQAIG